MPRARGSEIRQPDKPFVGFIIDKDSSLKIRELEHIGSQWIGNPSAFEDHHGTFHLFQLK